MGAGWRHALTDERGQCLNRCFRSSADDAGDRGRITGG